MKKRTSVYIDAELLEFARKEKIKISQLLESAIKIVKNRNKEDILGGFGPPDPGSNPGGPVFFFIRKSHVKEFYRMLQLSNISDKEIKKNMSRLNRFLEATSYRINDDRIIIYINELKKIYRPKTVRHHLTTIKRFLRFVGYPSADLIKPPKVPKRRKTVIKPDQIRKILEKADLQTRAAVLLAATSGLRAEELFKLTLDDIDMEERTIYVRAEIAKDYEDRITFFSEEAKLALQNYLSVRRSSSIYLFPESTIRKKIRRCSKNLRMKHMRKFFSQQSDRLGMPTAIKKMLIGHVVSDVDLGHYDFQDEEELKKIYDKYWKDFRIC